MTRTVVKICGLTSARDAAFAVEAGADAVGFVFWQMSPRAVSVEAAARIVRDLPVSVLRVGVFVNADPEAVARVIGVTGIDAVQLHGDERVGDYAGLPVRLIKSVSVSTVADVDAASTLPEAVTLLVDVADDVRRGGTGRTVDWNLAARLAARRPVWLAGGLSAGNVVEAVRAVRPSAVDVSSGVEAAPGVKDRARIAAFVAAVRAAEGEPL